MKPPSPRSRATAKQETREALLRAAAELFQQQGLDASLDAICAHAGYTRGAFYVHFRDRDELMSAVVAQGGDALLDNLLGKEDSEDDLFMLMQRFLLSLSDGSYPLTRQGGLRPYQLMEACARSDDIRDQYLRLKQVSVSRLAAALRRSQEKGMIRNDISPESAALIFINIVVGVQTMLDIDMPMDLAAGAQTMLQMLQPARLES